jgi:hypothetical protein
VRWTVFKSQFCGFAAQKYSTKPQLKNCRLARRYDGKENLFSRCFAGFTSKAKTAKFQVKSVFGSVLRKVSAL